MAHKLKNGPTHYLVEIFKNVLKVSKESQLLQFCLQNLKTVRLFKFVNSVFETEIQTTNF
jgi:hypothetical protein